MDTRVLLVGGEPKKTSFRVYNVVHLWELFGGTALNTIKKRTRPQMEQSKWSKFIGEVDQLIKFWLVGIGLFFLYRVAFIALFYGDIQNDVSAISYWNVFKMGFRFDTMIVSYFLLLPLVSLLILAFFDKFEWIRRIRIVCQFLLILLGVGISIIAINYYEEFREVFDNNLFVGLVEEDAGVITEMIWKYKNPLLNLSIWVGSVWLGVRLLAGLSHRSLLGTSLRELRNKYLRGLVVVLGIYLFVSGLRGTFTGNILRFWDSAVTVDPFLNKTVLNPFKSLELAFRDYREAHRLGEANPYIETPEQLDAYPSVQQHIEHQAAGAQIERPRQIFLVIMESYDAWPLMDKYRPIGISKHLSRIADAGTTFMNFLPSYNNTIYGYNSIVASIPFVGVNMSQVNKTEESVVSSIFEQFKRLGYRTQFFYGGYLSWQKIGRFTDYLGCDRAYSAADIGVDFKEGCWAVEDEVLFDYILDTIDPHEYTFNVILTASNHPPYVIDVYDKGFAYHSLDELPASVRSYFDGSLSIEALAHRWYGDYAIGHFMDQAEEQYPEAVYAFTGDHYGRKFIHSQPTLYEKSAVPFIVYGEQIPAQQLATPGSHIDILPTLIDLVAPAGFTYHSFGTSMWQPNKAYGMGYKKIITQDSIYVETDDHTITVMDLATQQESTITQYPYGDEYSYTMALAWQYIARGDKIKEEGKALSKNK